MSFRAFAAVSYTHLDVYKRQLPILIEEGDAQPEGGAARRSDLRTVSYTHLGDEVVVQPAEQLLPDLLAALLPEHLVEQGLSLIHI